MSRRFQRTIPITLLCILAFICTGATLAHYWHDTTQRTMPLSFPHEPHGQFSCVMCHHDSADPALEHAPFKGCVACHKHTPALSAHTETTFHTLCESCHLALHEEHARTGPVKDCAGCHYTHHPLTAETFLLR